MDGCTGKDTDTLCTLVDAHASEPGPVCLKPWTMGTVIWNSQHGRRPVTPSMETSTMSHLEAGTVADRMAVQMANRPGNILL
jgi:hypothetical protein